MITTDELHAEMLRHINRIQEELFRLEAHVDELHKTVKFLLSSEVRVFGAPEELNGDAR